MRLRFVILFADDDENDRLLMRRALKRAGVSVEARDVHDGEEVIRYLQAEGPYADREKFPFPDLLVLDLKMPRVNGHEVLEWLQQHPECRTLPVVMVSGSGLDEDVVEAHRRGVRAYFVKPGDFDKLQSLVLTIAEHWAQAKSPALPEKG